VEFFPTEDGSHSKAGGKSAIPAPDGWRPGC